MTEEEWNLRYSKKLQKCEKFMKTINGDDYSFKEDLRRFYNLIGIDSITLSDKIVEEANSSIRKIMQTIIDLDRIEEQDELVKIYFGDSN